MILTFQEGPGGREEGDSSEGENEDAVSAKDIKDFAKVAPFSLLSG